MKSVLCGALALVAALSVTFPAAAATVNFAGTFDGASASGSLSYDEALISTDCDNGDECVTLGAVTGFTLTFADPPFSALGPFGVGDLMGSADLVVLEFEFGAPIYLALDIQLEIDSALSFVAEIFENDVFTFSGSVDGPMTGLFPGPGFTGGGGDVVVPLPATLPLLLGALGLGGLVLRRRPA